MHLTLIFKFVYCPFLRVKYITKIKLKRKIIFLGLSVENCYLHPIDFTRITRTNDFVLLHKLRKLKLGRKPCAPQYCSINEPPSIAFPVSKVSLSYRLFLLVNSLHMNLAFHSRQNKEKRLLLTHGQTNE